MTSKSQRARELLRAGVGVKEVAEMLDIDLSWARKIARQVFPGGPRNLIRVPYETKRLIQSERISGRSAFSVAVKYHVQSDYVRKIWAAMEPPKFSKWQTFTDEDGTESPTPATIQSRALDLLLWKIDHGVT